MVDTDRILPAVLADQWVPVGNQVGPLGSQVDPRDTPAEPEDTHPAEPDAQRRDTAHQAPAYQAGPREQAPA